MTGVFQPSSPRNVVHAANRDLTVQYRVASTRTVIILIIRITIMIMIMLSYKSVEPNRPASRRGSSGPQCAHVCGASINARGIEGRGDKRKGRKETTTQQ